MIACRRYNDLPNLSISFSETVLLSVFYPSTQDGGDHLRLHSPYDSPPKNGLDKTFSDVLLYSVPSKAFFPSDTASGSVHSLSSGGSDSVHGHMKAMAMDAFRVSLSSAVSSSSQGSGHDDGDALGDVFIWGGRHRGWCFGWWT